MVYYLGIDLGTTGLKAVLSDKNGKIYGIGYREYPLHIPKVGYAEQDPKDWYRAMCKAIQDVLHQTGIAAGAIRCIGFSGQMHGLVALGKDKNTLRPAIIHCDGRASKQKREVMEKIGVETLGAWVQNQLHSGFQALSLVWMRECEPELYQRIRHVLTPKDYLRFCLTGEVASEVTDASGTLMYDSSAMCWSRELLKALEIDPAILPDANHRPCDQAGRVSKIAASETGLAEGTLVSYGGADQVMQAVGNGLLSPGDSSVNLGTSGQVFVSTDKMRYDPKLRTHTFCHASQGSWYVMGAVLNACLAANWFHESILNTADYVHMHEIAARSVPGCGGLIFLPYLTGERTPHMNEHARGAFIGLTLGHQQADLERAVLEGVAFSLKSALDLIRALDIPIGRMVISGGGARSMLWKQIFADIFELPLSLSCMKEQAALGALLCAQVADGAYSSLDEACRAIVHYEPEPILPNPLNYEVYRKNYRLYCDAYKQNVSLFEQM